MTLTYLTSTDAAAQNQLLRPLMSWVRACYLLAKAIPTRPFHSVAELHTLVPHFAAPIQRDILSLISGLNQIRHLYDQAIATSPYPIPMTQELIFCLSLTTPAPSAVGQPSPAPTQEEATP